MWPFDRENARVASVEDAYEEAGETIVVCFVALLATGCMTGPSYCWRSVDDAQNKNYGESPVFTGFMTDVLPIYPIIKFLAWIPDVLILNPVQFWGFDIW